MFGLLDSKSEKLTKKSHKISKEIWATARKLCRKGPSDFWIKYLIDTEAHLNEVLSDLKKETDDGYVQNIMNNLEKEYLKSPFFISEEHWEIVNDLTMNYRIKHRIPLTK